MDYKAICENYFPHLRILCDFSDPSIKNMTEEEAKEFFTRTRLQGGDGSIKPFGYGGSDIGPMLSLSPFKSSSALARAKRGEIEEHVTAEQQEIFDVGHRAEAFVRDEMFSRLTGIKTFEWPLQVTVKENEPDAELFRHAIANIDGLVVENRTLRDSDGNPVLNPDGSVKTEAKIGIYEGKAPANAKGTLQEKAREIRDGRKAGLTDKELIKLVPPYYLVQMWFYMAVYRVDFGYFCVGWGFRNHEVAWVRVPALEEEDKVRLLELCEEWVGEVAMGITPSDVAYSDKAKLLKLYREEHKKVEPSGTIKLDSETAKTARRYLQLEEEISSCKARIKKTIDAEKEGLEKEAGLKELQESKDAVEATLKKLLVSNEAGNCADEHGRYEITYVPEGHTRFTRASVTNWLTSNGFDESVAGEMVSEKERKLKVKEVK